MDLADGAVASDRLAAERMDALISTATDVGRAMGTLVDSVTVDDDEDEGARWEEAEVV